jgi:tRNA dimethylallyltransferase
MHDPSATDGHRRAPLVTGDRSGDRRPVTIALMGPTASGKTDLALELAETLDLAVLSVDSRQLYRGMDVGTAKPTAAQRRRVRHELLDLRDPDEPINLQSFTALAQAAIAAEHRRRGVALLVGGSGLYLEALLRGLAPPPVPPQPVLRAQLEHLGQPLCHGLLRQGDPEAAARIAPADAVRTQRALEVIYATGRPLSSQRCQQPPPWRVLELGLQPTDLAERIRRRTVRMYDEGLVEETAGLLARFGADCPLLRTMGYDEARRMLAGELDRAEAIALTERRTRQYAKRQRTWFRRRHSPVWLGMPPEQSPEQTAGKPMDQAADHNSRQAARTEGGAAGTAGDLLRETLELTQHVLG